MQKQQNYYKFEDEKTPSIYDIWERGENHGDSVTPSTWSNAYRRMITQTLCRYVPSKTSKEKVNILSLGCGNAVVEGELINRGYNVFGLDVNCEALAYAAKKGVATIESDFYKFLPDIKFDLVYADGFFGHLWAVDQNARSIYQRAANLLLKQDGVIIVSNDAPRLPDKELQKHPSVPDFYFMSGHYLMDEAKSAGFKNIEVNTFFYKRPVSGTCPRSVVVSKLV